MTDNNLTYGHIVILLHLLLWCCRISAFNVSDDVLKQDTLVVDSVATQNKRAAAILQAPLGDTGIPAPNPGNVTNLDSVAMHVLPGHDGMDFKPDPIRSMWLAMVFPGGGQIYNRKFWKLPIFYGGYLGCVYALTWNNQMLRDYSQAYLDIMDDDPNTSSYLGMLPPGYSIEGKEERFKEIFKNKKNYFRKYRDLSIFAFVGVYALSIVDAYVDAELSSFDISKDLSLRWEPAVIGIDYMASTHSRPAQKAYGVQCVLTF